VTRVARVKKRKSQYLTTAKAETNIEENSGRATANQPDRRSLLSARYSIIAQQGTCNYDPKEHHENVLIIFISGLNKA
jgi:hypothetical protein